MCLQIYLKHTLPLLWCTHAYAMTVITAQLHCFSNQQGTIYKSKIVLTSLFKISATGSLTKIDKKKVDLRGVTYVTIFVKSV